MRLAAGERPIITHLSNLTNGSNVRRGDTISLCSYGARADIVLGVDLIEGYVPIREIRIIPGTYPPREESFSNSDSNSAGGISSIGRGESRDGEFAKSSRFLYDYPDLCSRLGTLFVSSSELSRTPYHRTSRLITCASLRMITRGRGRGGEKSPRETVFNN